MTPAGIGQKTNRTKALELHRLRWNPADIAHALDEDVDQVREWIYGPARRAERRRQGISPASSRQRSKVKDRRCIVSGDTEDVDPAHLWPRALGGCDDPLCVVPLARRIHRAFDDRELDLLPALVAGGYHLEIQHALGHANSNLIALLERLTGDRYVAQRRAGMHPAQLDVQEFHEALDGLVGSTPAMRQRDLRAALIREEADELVEAIEKDNLLAAVKEACDLLCVTYGAAVDWGVDLAPFWTEVHLSNMAKQGGATRGDGKHLKPAGWTPPDLQPILEEQLR